MESHTVSLLRIKEDGSSLDFYVGGVEIDETDGLLGSVCFEPEPDYADYIEKLGLIFNPPNSPLILNFRVDGGRRFVWYVGDSEGEWLDPDLLDEREFRSVSECAERAARRLMQRARLAMPILVVPDPLESDHRLFSRANRPYACPAVTLTGAPPLTTLHRARRRMR